VDAAVAQSHDPGARVRRATVADGHTEGHRGRQATDGEDPMVVVDSLSKRFGRLEVLKDVNATFEPGHVTAVVGPNAAGKSTLMKSILGLVIPDKGSVTILGQPTKGNPAARERVGYMPQEPRFPDNLRVSELFDFVQDLRGAHPTGLDSL